MLSHFSHVWFFATQWTIAHQAPLSMGFSRQEHWSELPFPPLGDLLNPATEFISPMSTFIGRQVLYQQCHLCNLYQSFISCGLLQDRRCSLESLLQWAKDNSAENAVAGSSQHSTLRAAGDRCPVQVAVDLLWSASSIYETPFPRMVFFGSSTVFDSIWNAVFSYSVKLNYGISTSFSSSSLATHPHRSIPSPLSILKYV